jgi:cyclophilin family peptidyl-prolyl cis-trans isomerase/HEAT repeat protein
MNRRERITYVILSLALLLGNCVPVQDEPQYVEATVDFSDEVIIKIKDFQDRQLLDSLLLFLNHENPSYRLAAAEAFASYQDSAALSSLIPLLDDPFEKVRAAAAYSVGQIGSPQAEPALIKAFNQFDSTAQHLISNRNILEAVGKIGSLSSLRALATVATYGTQDTQLVMGQTRGIYQFGLRNMVVPEGTARMVQYVSDRNFPTSVRVMAGNYLLRARNIQLDTFIQDLIPLFMNEQHPEIRMALAVALGKAKNEASRNALIGRLKTESDPRVLTNILRALNNFGYREVKQSIFPVLQHKNLDVASLAADFFIRNGIKEDALQYRSLSKQNNPWPVKARLYEASNKHLPNYYTITKTNINNEIETLFRQSKSPMEKAAYLSAWGQDLRNYGAIWENGFRSKNAFIKTSAVQILHQISAAPAFKSVFRGNRRSTTEKITSYFIQAIEGGDVGAMAIAAGALRDENSNLGDEPKKYIERLKESLNQLQIPKDIETYNELLETIGYLEGSPVVRRQNGYNHPINWSLVKSSPDTVRAEMITSKGLIELALFMKEAPGTVVNFMQLAREQFYHGKNFHRVVPNFVIQGGCPRGDGYGSLDYSIRSELGPLHFDGQGYIGMASAGKHTEGTQFFITHSPTPHLDGRYTIFGRVTKGMDIVHQIAVGDLIREVNILN